MTEFKNFYRKFLRPLTLIWLVAVLGVTLGCAHKTLAQQPPASPPAKQSADSSAPEVHSETRISPKEAEELFQQVDEILKFASDDTGLPIKKEVKRRLTGRNEVEAYLQKNMAEDKDAQRLSRSQLVLKKFGLLPRDFDLQTFLVALLKEQVAGYYDPKTKTVNLLDWVGIEQQKPVMAHELTHALQDQSFGLERWMKEGDIDLDTKKDITSEDIERDEITTARQAVIEGQAMVTLVDYMLAPTGQTVKDSPQVVEALKQGMLTGTPDSVQFHSAPIFLKEALTFPYRYGLDFEAALLVKGGKTRAFYQTLINPPHNTRQIMEPQTYLAGEKIPPMPMPDFKKDLADYERFDVGAMGEFDVAVLIDQYAGEDASHQLYPEWRGGYYYAARPKGNPASPLGLVYVSRWSNPQKASEFAAIYTKALSKRYRQVREAGTEADKPAAAPDAFTGKRSWTTEDGTVEINVHDDIVFITESLDEASTKMLEQDVLMTPAPK